MAKLDVATCDVRNEGGFDLNLLNLTIGGFVRNEWQSFPGRLLGHDVCSEPICLPPCPNSSWTQ